MKSRSLALLLVFTGSAALAWGGTEVIEIGTRDVPYQLKAGANVETGVVKYHAYLTRQIVEGGEPSSWTHPVDDRHCDWHVQAHLEREVCFTSIMGGQSCNNGLKKELPFAIDANNGPLSGVFDHRPCTDAIGQIDSSTQSVRRAVDLQALSDADLSGDLASTMRGRGATVTYRR